MVEKQLHGFFLTNNGSGRDKYCVLCEFVHYYEDIVETMETTLNG